MKIVILAGGGGTRLWPVSRKNKPKQIQPFIGNKTLLQKTFDRVAKGFKSSDIFVSTNYSQQNIVKKQIPRLPKENYILETVKKDTAAAIGLAAVFIAKRNPKDIMMMANSDGYIRNEKEYIRLLRLAEKTVRDNPKHTLLLGIRPTYPETGYGYVKINKIFKQSGNDEIFLGQKFVEKPDLKEAEKYVKSWDYLWNPAMFCWRVDYLLSLYKKYLPAHYKILLRIQESLGTKEEKSVVMREFKKIKPISIDYGIIERTRKLLVIPASFDWADVGHWRTVKDILAKSQQDNVIRGKNITIDSNDNLIYSYTGKLITTAGIENMIIIDTDDCLLVCSKNKAQDVKKIVEQLEKKKMKKYL